jgi:hypothetical protein
MLRSILSGLVATAGFSTLLGPPPAAADPPPALYRIIPHGRPVHAGDHVEFRLVPEPPPGVLKGISITTAGGRTASLVGPYRAPYVIAEGSPPVEVVAALAGDGWRREVKTTLELFPGELTGTDDCLGPDQSFLPEYGDLAGSAGDLSDMPRILRAVPARLPAGGFEGTVIVQTLVCRSGQVLDAWVPPVFRDSRGEAIQRDPKIVDAAIAAARLYVFGRGRAATWVAIPVSFRR